MFIKKTVEEQLLEKTLRDFRKELEAYKKKMKSLVNKDLDYQFLQELVNEVAEKNGEVEVHITLENGTKLDIIKPVPTKQQRPSFE